MNPGVIELRQYQLHPGRRDELIELFDAFLVEPQERAGMRVLGQFRDLDRPDWFVWLRGFDDMARRTAALGDFYHGPVWAQHRAAANATMVDSDDVLLLRSAPSRTPCWEPGCAIGLVEIVVRTVAPGGEERALRRVPVREGECVVVTVAGFDDAAHHARYRDLAARPEDETQLLRLAPTAGSRLGGAGGH